MRGYLRIAIVIATFVLNGGEARAEDPNVVPKAFRAQIGGGPTEDFCAVELRQGVVHYSARGFNNDKVSAVITPSIEQWREFRRSWDELKVWQWQASYFNKNLADGTLWKVEIQYGDQQLTSTGQNAYPDAAGQMRTPDPGETFDKYCKAIETLLGGKSFR